MKSIVEKYYKNKMAYYKNKYFVTCNSKYLIKSKKYFNLWSNLVFKEVNI